MTSLRLLAVLSLLTLWPCSALPATIYLCKSYSGGMFWSSAHCQHRQALIERMVSVPDGMPFEQQVELGKQAVAQAARSTAAPTPPPARQESDPKALCGSLDAKLRAIDAAARQPQSGAGQDRLAAQRRAVREEQHRRRC
jgi:hypothetical protein